MDSTPVLRSGLTNLPRCNTCDAYLEYSDLTSFAKAILANDQREALGVLVVNWEEGSRYINTTIPIWQQMNVADKTDDTDLLMTTMVML